MAQGEAQAATNEEIKNTVIKSTGSVIKANKSASLMSESIVRERLTQQLGANEAILEKPRIYIGDGSSGKYAMPDFAVYNTKTGQIIKLVDAKNGRARLSVAQEQIRQYGGIFRGSSRAPVIPMQQIAASKEAIRIERTNIVQDVN